MNELISIKKQLISNTEVNAVNARELHQFLEVETRFDTWISRRISEYAFVINSDFCTILSKSNGGRPAVEYYISLDMAKELSMVERNEKGKEARKYFIECERKLKENETFKIPQTYSQALKLAAEQAEQIEEQQKLIEVQKPKAEFFDTVTGSKDTIDMATVAKVLNKGIGRNKLFELLRDNNILDKRNQPYQTFIDRGYFRQVESSYIKPDGTNCIHVKTVVYQKGLNFISKLIDKSKNGN
jgi:anti-repressor protein